MPPIHLGRDPLGVPVGEQANGQHDLTHQAGMVRGSRCGRRDLAKRPVMPWAWDAARQRDTATHGGSQLPAGGFRTGLLSQPNHSDPAAELGKASTLPIAGRPTSLGRQKQQLGAWLIKVPANPFPRIRFRCLVKALACRHSTARSLRSIKESQLGKLHPQGQPLALIRSTRLTFPDNELSSPGRYRAASSSKQPSWERRLPH